MIATPEWTTFPPKKGESTTHKRHASVATRLETSLESSARSCRTSVSTSEYMFYVESDDFF
ncbi:MAG: hypothetical protein K8F59_06270 [Rhodobacteraceae bacterium]|nr:hypothetical protein [Paracoccaceae bacterium]MCB1369093.1 hypothetical protein [Paracoccaceae bacterium]